jgi:hypothetical protein
LTTIQTGSRFGERICANQDCGTDCHATIQRTATILSFLTSQI